MPRKPPKIDLGKPGETPIPEDRRSAHARGYGRAWQRTRLTILAGSPLCVVCLAAGIEKTATDVDHITPKARGGRDEFSNLQSLCHECHSEKTAREDGGFGRS